MYHGIINVYKERGYTSHDVVAKLRGILGQRKIGHTGTLDPDAEGVLPVCLGSGTKLCDMLTDRDKVYEAGLLLGVTTDTLDITGTVTGQVDWEEFVRDEAWKAEEMKRPAEGGKEPFRGSDPEWVPEAAGKSLTESGGRSEAGIEKNQKRSEKLEERICGVLSSFVGKQMQIPPMYSALKVNGKKLVDLARTGAVIERKPREIEIYSIEVLSMELPHIRLLVHCGKGTYIRSLCDDIGCVLGCGGCMESLIRRAVGPFGSEDAKTLDEIAELRDKGELERYIIPPDEIFDYPSLWVDDSYLVPAENGNPIPAGKLEQTAGRDIISEQRNPDRGEKGEGSNLYGAEKREQMHRDEKESSRLFGSNGQTTAGVPGSVKIYLPDGRFLGIYRWNSEKESYVPEKIFLSRTENPE